jgi:hypothetical protein
MALIDPAQMLMAMIDSGRTKGRLRPYIGFSAIGGECMARTWYAFRWAAKPPDIHARKQRIFDRGNLEEARVVKELKKIGCEVFKRVDGKKVEMTGAEGEIQEEFTRFNGHVRGHPDGRVLNLPGDEKEEYILEIKTAGESGFKKMCRHGLEKSNRSYYAQVQRNMGAAGLKKTLFIIVNKNDESWKIIIVHFDEAFYNELLEKEEFILTSEKVPPKAFKPGHFKCDDCLANLICHMKVIPDANCRTCMFGTIKENGTWACGKTKKELSIAEQEAGCKKYKRLF